MKFAFSRIISSSASVYKICDFLLYFEFSVILIESWEVLDFMSVVDLVGNINSDPQPTFYVVPDPDPTL
jgi:hypothetical protein